MEHEYQAVIGGTLQIMVGQFADATNAIGAQRTIVARPHTVVLEAVAVVSA